MGRGMGTAVGLAVTSLLLELGAPSSPAAHDRTFALTAVVLAVVAVLGALAASLARTWATTPPLRVPPTTSVPSTRTFDRSGRALGRVAP
jgi:hypothetical protein